MLLCGVPTADSLCVTNPAQPDADGTHTGSLPAAAALGGVRMAKNRSWSGVDPLIRNNVTVAGNPTGRPVVLVHGFGCDQSMWRRIIPRLADDRLVLLDLVGSGGSDVRAYDPARYDSLDAHADDLVDVLTALDLQDVVLVGHSVSAMIVVLASRLAPERVGALALVCPSPRYIDDEHYVGGFSRETIDSLLASVAGNASVWSAHLASIVMGNPDRPELADELAASFCQTHPEVAAHFAEVTFLSDNRADLPHVTVPTLVMQTREDAIAPEVVGQYVNENIRGSRLVHLDATGHCPHVSHPQETAQALHIFMHPDDVADAPPGSAA